MHFPFLSSCAEKPLSAALYSGQGSNRTGWRCPVPTLPAVTKQMAQKGAGFCEEATTRRSSGPGGSAGWAEVQRRGTGCSAAVLSPPPCSLSPCSRVTAAALKP